MSSHDEERRHWTFLSNHGHVLIAIAREPDLKVRDIARLVGITERSVQNILHDLQEAGFVEVFKQGRRNHYSVRFERSLRHPLESDRTVGDLIQLLNTAKDLSSARSP